MHVARQNPTEIVLQDGMMWMSLLFSTAAIAVGVAALVQARPKGLWGVALFLVFAMITARHTTVRFDALQRIATWRSRTLFKMQSGNIPFDEISDIVIDALASSTHSGDITYRLALVTGSGITPLSSSYSGGTRARFESLRQQILDVVKPGAIHLPTGPTSAGIPANLESSVHVLLAQGRKIDAIELLRSSEHIGLTEAVQRINNLEKAQAR
jgi:hypothetical protein